MTRALSDVERRAIQTLERLGKRWPRSLMVASMGGTLVVIPTADHERDDGYGGVDASKVLATIAGIPNTGGDW